MRALLEVFCCGNLFHHDKTKQVRATVAPLDRIPCHGGASVRCTVTEVADNPRLTGHFLSAPYQLRN
jgi:hypothetical protein